MAGIVKQQPAINSVQNHRQGGFTIIELMITVSIAAILAGLAFPSFEYAIANSRVRTAATDVHMSLLMARSEAIKRNGDVDVTNNTNWKDGWDVKSGSTVIRGWDAVGDVAVDCVDEAGNACGSTITFKRSGRLPPSSPYAEFRLYDSDNNNIPARCVRVSLSGRAGVVIDDDNDPTNGCG